MCVIIFVEKEEFQPDLDTLVKCYERNSDQHNTDKGNKDGIGIAWHRNGVPHYVKGKYKPEDIPKLLDDHGVTIPYAIHFRASSVGTPVEELIHPHEISLDVPHNLEAMPINGLVFQNGTWTGWKREMLKMAMLHRLEIPPGPWNDARAIAWLMALTGFNTVDWLLEDDRNPSRLIAFLPDGEIKYRGEWHQHMGMWFSQMKWNEEKKPVVIEVKNDQNKNDQTKSRPYHQGSCLIDGYMAHPQRENICKSLKGAKTQLISGQNTCLMEFCSPLEPQNGDKCGKCGNEAGFRYGCKSLPKDLTCTAIGCNNKITNPKISVSTCQECLAKFSESINKGMM